MTGGAAKFYSVISDPTQVAKNAVYIVTTLIADCFVVCSYFHIAPRSS